MLILGELSCWASCRAWTIFGVHNGDPRLATPGFTGVAASSPGYTALAEVTAYERPGAPYDGPCAAQPTRTGRVPRNSVRRESYRIDIL
jgi:hypothetical protein